MRSPEDVAVAFGRAARRAGVRYALIGGLAVSTWGQPRATQDVECLLELETGIEEELVAALSAEGLRASQEDFQDARAEGSHVTIHDSDSLFHVDCKLVATSDEVAQVREAAEVIVGAGPLRVARAEDTVAFKLLFGTPQDLQDVQSILHRQRARLDMHRLRALAGRLGVEGQLRRVLSQSEEAGASTL